MKEVLHHLQLSPRLLSRICGLTLRLSPTFLSSLRLAVWKPVLSDPLTPLQRHSKFSGESERSISLLHLHPYSVIIHLQTCISHRKQGQRAGKGGFFNSLETVDPQTSAVIRRGVKMSLLGHENQPPTELELQTLSGGCDRKNVEGQFTAGMCHSLLSLKEW